MARNWNPTLDQLILAAEAMDNARKSLQAALVNTSAHCSQEAIDAAMDAFEGEMQVVLDACSADVAYMAIARAAVADEIGNHNEASEQMEDDSDEDNQFMPEYIDAGTIEGMQEGAQMALDGWDADAVNSHAEGIYDALVKISQKD